MTPEWISKPNNKAKFHALVSARELSLIAIDESHLISEWSSFRIAFQELKQLIHEFKNTPIMALTASATPQTEEDIRQVLRSPDVKRPSINRSNIKLNVDGLPPDKSMPPIISRVAEICGSTTTVIHTDFVALIVSSFHKI